MIQSRLSSFYEALFNIAVGFSVNFAANLVLIPLFLHVEVPLIANWWMGCAYTVVSLVRSYVIRRWFNARLVSAAQRLASPRQAPTNRPRSDDEIWQSDPHHPAN